jgi:hypothetical protein
MNLRTRGRAGLRRGVTLVVTCLSLMGIVFLTALAIDCGNMMSQRRQAQNCCDAAALAGCLNLSSSLANGQTPTLANIQAAVNASASNNGYSTSPALWPPTSGNYANDNNSVEAHITFTYNNLIVGGSEAITVRAVANASAGSVPNSSMILLDPTASKSFWVNGGRLTLNGTNIQVNSTSLTAAVVDAGSTANATVRAVGGTSGTFNPAAKADMAPLANPYASVPAPSTSGLTTYSTSRYYPDGSGNITLNPGYYPNGLYCIDGGNVTLNSGLYYVEHGNLWINTTGTVTGNGVTLYHNGSDSTALLHQDFSLSCGIVFCPTNHDYTFTAQTTGTYAGISLFQGTNCTQEAFYDFWGTGKLNCGTQYFPNSTLRCWAINGTINCNMLVAKDFKLAGTHEIYGNTYNGGFSPLTWNATRASHAPPTSVALVE